MRAAPVCLTLLLLAVSGCASGPANSVEPSHSSATAGVRVVVQGNHNERVANATVLLTPDGGALLTDASGFAVFSDLSPGDKTVTVNAQGYSDATIRFLLSAGESAEKPVFIDRTG